ncbi:leucine-rich repeat and IQ domain-containing protein 1 [Esox lucius]|uniref:leucine-rich repeat and IQ domain-containing protein 1 n=1 Tax=Esox lucius TaxID=8010 RepID=UPI0014771566|nr:leucine-rich repeat and IQ domain-containing protein 1 [Esox lucius]
MNEEVQTKETSPRRISVGDFTDSMPHNDGGDLYLESEKQLSLELKALECKFQEEEKKILQYVVEQEKEQREIVLQRKCRQRAFEEELRSIEDLNIHYPTGAEKLGETETEQRLKQEFLKQQEVISCLQRQIEDERKALEKEQEKELLKTHRAHCEAATTIQAALRGLLVRRWTRTELHRRGEERRRCEEERRRKKESEERCRREQKEQQRLMQEEEERRRELEKQELESRRAEYERTKEEERVRVEKKKRERKIEDEDKRKEEERRKREEEKRKVDEEVEKKDEEELQKQERRKCKQQIREKVQRKDEESERTRQEKTGMESYEKQQKKLLETSRVNAECQRLSEQKAREESPSLVFIKPTDSASGAAVGPMRVSLTQRTELRRLAWMRECTPWSKLSLLNKRKQKLQGGRTTGRRGLRRANEGSASPPLCPDTLLQSGAWRSLQEITTLVLEDLPGCSLSTLSQCPRLQSLTMGRCGLVALDGLSQCTELSYVDVQDNSITFVNCENLVNLRVLRLGRNRLTSVRGLAGAVNLDVLELSHNSITRIGGLEPLTKLQTLLLDHNQLISSKGLTEVYTLLHLDLSHNHLSSVDGLENCALLSVLDLTGNNLTEPPSLKNQVLLKELHLQDNSISSIEDLTDSWLPLMQLLCVAQNSITQLPPLSDFVSLERLDIRHNCLSELQNLCDGLAGCLLLREVHLTGNPLQQEPSWRSSLREAVPGLQNIDCQPPAPPPGPVRAPSHLPQDSFLSFCQAQLLQLQALQHRHTKQLSDAVSPLDALRLTLQFQHDSLQLAVEHRYAHEYGDTSVCDRHAECCARDTANAVPVLEANVEVVERRDEVAGVTGRVQPDRKSCGDSSERLCVVPLARCGPANENTEDRNCEAQFSSPGSNKTRTRTVSSQADQKPVTISLNASTFHQEKEKITCAISCPEKKLDLKNGTAVVCPPPGKTSGRGEERGRIDTGPSHTGSRQSCLEPCYAATIIQAVWRGFALRRRLAAALTQARCLQHGDQDEAFEEVDVEEFVFDETTLEADWTTIPLSDNSPPETLPHCPPFPGLQRGPKCPLTLPETAQQTSPHLMLRKPKPAWMGGERAEPSEKTLSPESSSKTKSPGSASVLSGLSERSEKILEEWGFTDRSTALLMLKRARKMASKKPQRRKRQDPSVRLALFRNHSNQHAPVGAVKKPLAERREYIKARQAEIGLEGTARGDKTLFSQEAPARGDQKQFNQEAPARGDQTLFNQEAPARGDQTWFNHEAPARGNQTRNNHEAPARGDQKRFNQEVPARGDQTWFNHETQARGDQTQFNQEEPAREDQTRFNQEEPARGDQTRFNQERTYQWLHTQAVHVNSRSPESEHFLPEIDPDILNGGRVQLVALAGYREGPDQISRSQGSSTLTSPSRKEHNQAWRHSMGLPKKEDKPPSPQRPAGSKKERMSFRDNPVLMSGGWGGGKKRDKLHK